LSDPTGEALRGSSESASASLHAPTPLISYLHFKGGTYTLLYLAENSEQREQILAVYVSHLRSKVLVRPWDMFREPVLWPDGQMRARFTPLVDAKEEWLQPVSAK
jgi:hypothetical protein